MQNASVTYTATVTPSSDGGTVSFNDGAGNPATAHCAAQSLSGGTATCTVSYANIGDYSVTATYSGDGAMNNYAVSASTTHTVVVAPPVVAAPVVTPPLVTPPVVAPPALSKLSVSPHTFKATGRKVHGRCVKATGKNKQAKPCQLTVKLKATYTLNAAVQVSFKLALKTTGQKVNGRCVEATRKSKQHSKCTLLVGVLEPITSSGAIGSNTFSSTDKLAAGTYQLTATPAGGTPQTATFHVTG